jgi:GntR family transcriptional regulator
MTSPTYREIADDLECRIRAGEYRPGTAIPSYRGLSRMYGKSVTTVQRSVGLLVDRGLCVGRPGVGVFVRSTRPARRATTTDWPGRPANIQSASSGVREAARVEIRR